MIKLFNEDAVINCVECLFQINKNANCRLSSELVISSTYNSVLTCRQNFIKSSASTPLNATKIAMKKFSDVVVCMFGPDL